MLKITKIKKFFLLIILSSLHTFGQHLPHKAKLPPQWMIELANNRGLEVVYGDRIPYINPFSEGNFGSPVIQGYLKSDEKICIDRKKNLFTFKLIPYYLFFLRKKKNNKLGPPRNNNGSYLDYYSSFDYYLAFAINNSDNYEIKGIYEYHFVGLQGYYWGNRSEWKDFFKLAKQEQKQDYSIKYKINLSEIQNNFPIISYSDMGYTVYVVYNFELYFCRFANP